MKIKEDTTGVATVSSPEVGANIKYPLGSTPDKYKEKNKKFTLKMLKNKNGEKDVNDCI